MIGHKSNRMAENLGVKNAKWDKKAGYVVPRSCYNSYFYKVEDDSVSLLDKFILHGKELTKYLDGRRKLPVIPFPLINGVLFNNANGGA